VQTGASGWCGLNGVAAGTMRAAMPPWKQHRQLWRHALPSTASLHAQHTKWWTGWGRQARQLLLLLLCQGCQPLEVRHSLRTEQHQQQWLVAARPWSKAVTLQQLQLQPLGRSAHPMAGLGCQPQVHQPAKGPHSSYSSKQLTRQGSCRSQTPKPPHHSLRRQERGRLGSCRCSRASIGVQTGASGWCGLNGVATGTMRAAMPPWRQHRQLWRHAWWSTTSLHAQYTWWIA
jgi:hypothetical protein